MGARIRNWLSKRREYARPVPETESGVGLVDSVFTKCERCGQPIYEKELRARFNVCPHCEFHYPLSAPERIRLLTDRGSFQERDKGMVAEDPLGFESYGERLQKARKNTGLDDAIVSGTGAIEGRRVALAALDFRFVGGSMGSVVGERVARTIEHARHEELPLVIVSASGGARMFEGVYSLMQMAKTSVALSRYVEGSRPYVSILTDPTFGGVTASFATAADIVLAEPGARIGFSGPRVIEQTTRERLPEGFQTAEFQREHGMVDRIVHRLTLKGDLDRLLGVHPVILEFERPIKDLEERISELRRLADPSQELGVEISRLEDALDTARRRIYSNLSPYQRVQVARHPDRPNFRLYRDALTDDFYELSGDRLFGDDPAVRGGFARLNGGHSVVLVGHDKGPDVTSRVKGNFGMAHPEGYRKVKRFYELAARFGMPVVVLVDTPGAFAGRGAEERGQAWAISADLMSLAKTPVPVVAVIIGEGCSGGALAMCAADYVGMLENSYLSVIAPEACASIIFRDSSRAAEAAEALKLTARDMKDHGIVDEVLPEPLGGAHNEPETVIEAVGKSLARVLDGLADADPDTLVETRYERYRRIGAHASKG